MKDKEVIKALECCVKGLECKNCPANPHKGNYGYCTSLLLKAALDLINRQKAEIFKEKNKNSKLRNERNRLKAEVERLTAERDAMHQDVIAAEEYAWKCKTAKAEAYKEYEKKVIEKMLAMVYSCDLLSTEDYIECIKSIGKEMVGDNNE